MYRRSSNDSRFSNSAARRGRGQGFRGGDGHYDLTRAMGRLSMGTATQIWVPPLSAFAPGGNEVCNDAKIKEAVPRAASIPTEYSSTSAYLKVNCTALRPTGGTSCGQMISVLVVVPAMANASRCVCKYIRSMNVKIPRALSCYFGCVQR